MVAVSSGTGGAPMIVVGVGTGTDGAPTVVVAISSDSVVALGGAWSHFLSPLKYNHMPLPISN